MQRITRSAIIFALAFTLVSHVGCASERERDDPSTRDGGSSSVPPAFPPSTERDTGPGLPPPPPDTPPPGSPASSPPSFPAPARPDRPDAGIPSSRAEPACAGGVHTSITGTLPYDATTPLSATVSSVSRDAIELVADAGTVTFAGWAAGDLSASFAPGDTVTYDPTRTSIRGARAEIVLLQFLFDGATGDTPDDLRAEEWDALCSSWVPCDLGNSEREIMNVLVEASGDRIILQPDSRATVGAWTVVYGDVINEACPVAWGRKSNVQAQRALTE